MQKGNEHDVDPNENYKHKNPENSFYSHSCTKVENSKVIQIIIDLVKYKYIYWIYFWHIHNKFHPIYYWTFLQIIKLILEE